MWSQTPRYTKKQFAKYDVINNSKREKQSYIIIIHFLPSSSTCKEVFTLKRSSGQAVVTGAFPSPPPVHAFIFIANRKQHSHISAFDARQFPSNFTNSARQFLTQEQKVPTIEHEYALGRIRTVQHYGDVPGRYLCRLHVTYNLSKSVHAYSTDTNPGVK